jgi:hypothetical protein
MKKIYKLNFIKTKNFQPAKDNVNRIRRKLQARRKYLQNPKLHKEPLKFKNKKTNN